MRRRCSRRRRSSAIWDTFGRYCKRWSPTIRKRSAACIYYLSVERRQALYEWNATDAEYPREKCVHELFEEQVEKTPDAVAVVFENDFLSYAELNRRANRLAHYLRGLGVGPDARVAICVERSLEMVIGAVGGAKGGRGICAAGSRLSGGTVALHAGGQRADGAADPRASAELVYGAKRKLAGDQHL